MSAKDEKRSRHKQMIAMRKKGFTNVEIGSQFGISRERVRQLIGNLPPRESLVGKRFGLLTVTSVIQQEDRNVIVCDCDCGTVGVTVDRRSLSPSRVGIHSCGCAVSGENCQAAKLTDAKVRSVRTFCAVRNYERGVAVEAAKKFGIHRVYLSKLVNGRMRLEAGGPIKPSSKP